MSRLKSLSYFLFDISHLLNINYDNNLHSNMFLLIHELESNLTLVNLFTFHNVSINSRVTKVCSVCYADLHSTMFLLIQYHVYYLLLHLCYLHSTMFLLIRVAGEVLPSIRKTFTFHNVSINSLKAHPKKKSNLDLHSTMFLLIRV